MEETKEQRRKRHEALEKAARSMGMVTDDMLRDAAKREKARRRAETACDES